MRRFLPIILLAALFMLPMGVYGQVVNEEAGSLTDDEHVLLERLEDHGIPVPDSISIVEDTTGALHGYVDRIMAPRTVHLTPTRMKHPNDVEMDGPFPYLFGVESVQVESDVLPQTHVLAHETAHILSVHLNAEMGRPALGLHTMSSETQADIFGLVLGQLAFGWSPDALGFPETVEYPFVKNKPVSLLARQYCQIVKKTWSVENMKCGPGGVLTSDD